jgi:hypothetical protein
VATVLQRVTKAGPATEHATLLKFHNVKFNEPLEPAHFTVRQLEKGS